jgi:uncharacterized membrane protein
VTLDDAKVQGLERLLSTLMLRGVQVSAACLMAGLALWLADARVLWAARLLTAGLIALMATPMLRVAVSVVEAVRLRDWFFVGTTAAVAVLLAVTVGYSLITR